MRSPKKEKSPKKGIVGIIAVCTAVILIVVGILGFRKGGWFRSKNYDAQQVQSLMDYAKQLEDAGNSEAAAAVYELIAKYGDGGLISKANEEIPVVKADNDIEQFRQFVSGSKEDDDQ